MCLKDCLFYRCAQLADVYMSEEGSPGVPAMGGRYTRIGILAIRCRFERFEQQLPRLVPNGITGLQSGSAIRAHNLRRHHPPSVENAGEPSPPRNVLGLGPNFIANKVWTLTWSVFKGVGMNCTDRVISPDHHITPSPPLEPPPPPTPTLQTIKYIFRYPASCTSPRRRDHNDTAPPAHTHV